MEPTWGIVPEIYHLEWLLLGGVALACLVLPIPIGTIRWVNGRLAAVARRHRIAVVVVILTVLIGRAALLPKLGVPRPAIADEFGYLLTADTFAHGRLTNPTPPLWKHFETFHVFFVPTYQSQYPIGYPLILAASNLLTHNPWLGVYITTALMCGALTWMLQAWVPPYWAFVAGLLAALRFGLFTYWMNSFWGGSLAALGGCLVFGALPRIIRVARADAQRNKHLTLNALIMALGFAMLITTRPYEGFVACIPLACIFFVRLIRESSNRRVAILVRAVVPVTVVLIAVVALLALYQLRVTGHPFESPYEVASRQYHVSRPFIFQQPLPIPTYNHLELRWIYVHFEAFGADRMHYFWGYVASLKERGEWYWQFFVGPVLTLPFICSLFSWRRRKLRFVWVTLLALAGAVLVESWIQVHYVAPVFCFLMLLLVEGLRRLRAIRVRRYASGQRLVLASAAVFIAVFAIRCFAYPADGWENSAYWPPNWAYSTFRLKQREHIEDVLNAKPGQHLVLVRYRMAFHSPHQEFVYNGADLPGEKILWARSMKPGENCELIKAYRGVRNFWVADNWGSVVRFEPETEAQICNPRNIIYQPNRTREFYFRGSKGSAG